MMCSYVVKERKFIGLEAPVLECFFDSEESEYNAASFFG